MKTKKWQQIVSILPWKRHYQYEMAMAMVFQESSMQIWQQKVSILPWKRHCQYEMAMVMEVHVDMTTKSVNIAI